MDVGIERASDLAHYALPGVEMTTEGSNLVVKSASDRED